MIIEKIRYNVWRLAIVAAMLTWTYYRYELIGGTVKGMIHIGQDLLVTIFVTYKLYTSKFRWRSPLQFVSSKWDGKSKLISIVTWIFPWIFVFALVAGCIYKFDFDKENSLILIGFVFVIMFLNGIISFFNSCLEEKMKDKEE